jgi:long-chain acyl-CoA synthetase
VITPATLRVAYATGDTIRLATSGTSGRPRQVVRTAASWVDSFAVVADLCSLDATSQGWVPGPIASSMNAYAVCLLDHVGAAPVDDLAATTHLFCTPTFLADLVDHDHRPLIVVVAGDRLSPALRTRAEAAGHLVHHYYGAAQLSFVGWGRDAETLRLFPQVDVEARHGELWVSSPWLCLREEGLREEGLREEGLREEGLREEGLREEGLREEGLREEGLREEGLHPVLRTEVRDGRMWMSVGDRGSISPDGRLVVTGRPDTVITGGATVLLAEVEATLRPYARGEIAVVGRPHPRLGAVLVAVCTDPGDAALLPVIARRELPASHRPRAWSVLAALPTTPAGKIDRDRIAAP